MTVSKIKHTVNSDGQSVVTLTLKDWDSTTSDGLLIRVSDGKSKNSYGEPIVNIVNVAVDDKAAPVVEEVYYVTTNDSIIVVFSEEIDPSTVLSSRVVGLARIVRKQQRLDITYCNLSKDKVRMLCAEDLTKLELEITNLVLNDLIKKKNRRSY